MHRKQKESQISFELIWNLSKKCKLVFRQLLAFTAKSVRKCSITKQKSICEANLRWIFVRYWNEVNSNKCNILR